MQRFLTDDGGHSLTEYAILIGLILMAVVAIGVSTSEQIRLSTGTLSLALDDSTEVIQHVDASEVANVPAIENVPMKISIGTAFLLLMFVLLRKNGEPVRKKSRVPAPVLGKLAKERTDRINAVLRRYRSDMSNWELQVRHVMDIAFPHALKSSKIQAIQKVMSSHDQCIVVLTDKSGRFASTYPADVDTLSVDPNLSLTSAIAKFQNDAVECLLVVEDDRVTGIVTQKELITALNCMLHLVREIDAEHRAVLRRAVGV